MSSQSLEGIAKRIYGGGYKYCWCWLRRPSTTAIFGSLSKVYRLLPNDDLCCSRSIVRLPILHDQMVYLAFNTKYVWSDSWVYSCPHTLRNRHRVNTTASSRPSAVSAAASISSASLIVFPSSCLLSTLAALASAPDSLLPYARNPLSDELPSSGQSPAISLFHLITNIRIGLIQTLLTSHIEPTGIQLLPDSKDVRQVSCASYKCSYVLDEESQHWNVQNFDSSLHNHSYSSNLGASVNRTIYSPPCSIENYPAE